VKVLITGDAGFIGSHLWRRLEHAAELTGCDLKNGEDCRDFFRSNDEHFDLVFHCAATVGGRVGIDENAALLGANNFQLDGALFEWAFHTRPGRVVYFSSAAAYPTWPQNRARPIRMPESIIRLDHYSGAPDESYGWAKLMGEMVAQRVRKAGVPVTVVRPFSSYGFDQEEADYPFPAIIRRVARHDDPLTVWGDGTQVRDWIHVEDLVSALLVLVDAEVDGPVNLGTGIGTTIDQLARICMRRAGYEAPIEYLTDKPVGVHYRVCDNTLLRKYFEPQITIKEGVRRALEAVSV
jgi:nucleoside-diphosphate-sugar epimerase